MTTATRKTEDLICGAYTLVETTEDDSEETWGICEAKSGDLLDDGYSFEDARDEALRMDRADCFNELIDEISQQMSEMDESDPEHLVKLRAALAVLQS